MSGATYDAAGVSIEAGDAAVQRIKPLVRSTFRPEVLGDIGSFGGLFALSNRYRDPVLVSTTDGVGTKAMVASAAGRFDTIGIDLVAMCVDDLVCQGAEPLFFLDYIAVGKLDPDHIEQLVEGVAEGCRQGAEPLFFLDYVSIGRLEPDMIERLVGGVAEGCRQAGCALIGGEMAEHPGAMGAGEFDLVGFAVGVVERSEILDGSRVEPGQALVGLASPGLRSNGYSLARHVLFERAGRRLDDPAWPEPGAPTVADELLRPSVIYAPTVAAIAGQVQVNGVAHITGGGIGGNLNRALNAHTDAVVASDSWRRPRIFDELQRLGDIEAAEMAKVFNLGIGMVVVVGPDDVETAVAVAADHGVEAWAIGTTVAGTGQVQLR